MSRQIITEGKPEQTSESQVFSEREVKIQIVEFPMVDYSTVEGRSKQNHGAVA